MYTPNITCRYDECITKLTPFLKMSGWAVGGDDVIFIPISGLGGINLKDRIPAGVCSFYDGPSLIELLDTIKQPARYFEMPFRMPIHDKYRDMGTIILGKVQSSQKKAHHACDDGACDSHVSFRWRVASAGRNSS
jgi:peptide chain release factor subunit 3